jgi:hypothetical protein
VNVLIALGISLVFFYVLYLGFKEGLRLGKEVANGIMPVKIRSPIKLIKDIKLEHKETLAEKEAIKEERKYTESLAKMMSYTGEVEDEN